uniref:Uncharacterized protein n=1 Tax=Rhizophora mucronata TaxID=61149 RepID=A0A2P2NS64_RHIMU
MNLSSLGLKYKSVIFMLTPSCSQDSSVHHFASWLVAPHSLQLSDLKLHIYHEGEYSNLLHLVSTPTAFSRPFPPHLHHHIFCRQQVKIPKRRH